VTARFPELRFAFLEGGVGWACNLITDLVGHWERRRREAMESQVRPTNLDLQMLKDLFARYGGRAYEDKMDELLGCLSLVEPFRTVEEMTERAYRRRSTTSARCASRQPTSSGGTSPSASTSAAKPTT
jgi:hypothetical protein